MSAGPKEYITKFNGALRSLFNDAISKCDPQTKTELEKKFYQMNLGLRLVDTAACTHLGPSLVDYRKQIKERDFGFFENHDFSAELGNAVEYARLVSAVQANLRVLPEADKKLVMEKIANLLCFYIEFVKTAK